jgi:poly(hydroxyalkanoate) granule-associated protein
MIMPKGLKELAAETTESQLAVKIRESANQIWLAGLGASSKARQEGVKMFEALVAEGEKVQVTVDERLADMREKAIGTRLAEMVTGTWNEFEKVFDDGVGRALHALNIPTRKDIEVITKKLSEESEEEETHGRGRAHRAKAA